MNAKEGGENTEEGARAQEVDPAEVAGELSVKMMGMQICTQVPGHHK